VIQHNHGVGLVIVITMLSNDAYLGPLRCIICQEEIAGGLCVVDCGCEFRAKCALNWFEQTASTCPVCRCEIASVRLSTVGEEDVTIPVTPKKQEPYAGYLELMEALGGEDCDVPVTLR